MIINSDERQWTWMDEGLCTFTQYLTEKELDPDYPSRRGPAVNMIEYMAGDKDFIRPIMTNSEQILQFGNNAYGKPATALNILREVVMGPELFDYAFREYAQRWAFKSPTPADFFRTMEDASAVDLDWFWRGWFYSTDHVDISVDKITWMKMVTEDDELETRTVTGQIDDGESGEYDLSSEPSIIYPQASAPWFSEYRQEYPDAEIIDGASNMNFYEIVFKNEGGLISPIILEWTYADGSVEREFIPAEIWRLNENQVTKTFMKEKEVVGVVVDPDRMTADVNADNNVYPREASQTRVDQFLDGE